jgi:hypothetical protein
METNPIIDAARDQLRQGNTGQSIRLLLSVLENDQRYTGSLVRTLRVVEANYNAVRQQELKGAISFQEAQREYSKSNDALLSILDDLAAGRAPDMGPTPVARPWWWTAAAIAAGLLIVVTALVLLRNRGNSPKEVRAMNQPAAAMPAGAVRADCPPFDTGRLRVLILPFVKVVGESAAPELLIQNQIRTLAGNNRFPVDVEVYNAAGAPNSAPDERKARELAGACNAELVVYGIYENDKAGLQVNVSYAFLSANRREGTTGFQPLAAFRNMRSRHNMGLRKLDQAVLSLCAVMALREGNRPLAAKWLNKLEQPDRLEAKAKEQLGK